MFNTSINLDLCLLSCSFYDQSVLRIIILFKTSTYDSSLTFGQMASQVGVPEAAKQPRTRTFPLPGFTVGMSFCSCCYCDQTTLSYINLFRAHYWVRPGVHWQPVIIFPFSTAEVCFSIRPQTWLTFKKYSYPFWERTKFVIITNAMEIHKLHPDPDFNHASYWQSRILWPCTHDFNKIPRDLFYVFAFVFCFLKFKLWKWIWFSWSVQFGILLL